MNKLLRFLFIGFGVFIFFNILIGIIYIGLTITIPLVLLGGVLYGIFYLYKRSPFLQRMFYKYTNRKKKKGSSFTTYYEVDKNGNKTETYAYIYDEDELKRK